MTSSRSGRLPGGRPSRCRWPGPPEGSLAGLRIVVVGPTHPYKGGVAAHTTRAAQVLADAGHDVDLVSWSRLYPSSLYPGEQAVPAGEAEVEYERTTRALRWDR